LSRARLLLARGCRKRKRELLQERDASRGLPVLHRDVPWGGGGAHPSESSRAASGRPCKRSCCSFGPCSFLSRLPPRLHACLVVRVQTGDCSWMVVTSLLAAALWAISSTSSTERRRAAGAGAEFQLQSSRGAIAATAEPGHRFLNFCPKWSREPTAERMGQVCPNFGGVHMSVDGACGWSAACAGHSLS
jgi:hypothetical protein